MIREIVEEAMEDAGFDVEEDMYREYSGRGMYGKTCFGIKGDPADVTRFILFLSQEDFSLAEDLTGCMRVEELGLGSICFFPGFELEE